MTNITFQFVPGTQASILLSELEQPITSVEKLENGFTVAHLSDEKK